MSRNVNKVKKPIKKAKATKGFSLKIRIILIVIVFTLAPLFAVLYTNLKTSTESIMSNTQALNESVNCSITEKFDNYVTGTVKTIEIMPQSLDILAMNPADQERVIRKLAASDENINQIFLANSDGDIVFSTDIFTKGMNVTEERWFLEAIGGSQYISDSNFDKFSRIPIFLVSVPVLDIDQNPIGAMCAQISFGSIQTICQDTKTGQTGNTYIVDRNGIVLAHHKFEEMVLEEYNAVTNMIEGAVKVIKGEEGTSRYKNNKGIEVMGTYKQIPSTGWGVISEIEVWEVMQPVDKENTKYLIIAAISFLIAIIASFLFANMIVKPIKKMADIAGEYERGVLTNRIKIKSKDEIGRLQESFNAMADSLADILKRVNDAVGDVNNYSRILSENAGISAASIEEISAISESTAEGSKTQIESIQDTNDIAEELSSNVEKVSENTKEAADTAKRAANTAQEGTDNINIINEKMEVIKNNVADSTQMVEKLRVKSDEVTNIVNLIRNIAESTNMLALNAAIEAARAGEAGRGFAVVADEVRKLADQTKEASIDIEELLEEIQVETIKTVEAMNNGLTDVQQSTEAIKMAYGTFESIISQAENVSSEIISVSNSVYGLKDDMDRIMNALDKVSRISYATSEGTQNIMASTEEQTSALQEINESSIKLNEMAEVLHGIVGRFKL